MLLGFPRGPLAQEQVGDGRGNEDGGYGAEDNTKRHGEGKSLDALATQEEDAEQHDERGERGVDGTGQRLVDTVVEER